MTDTQTKSPSIDLRENGPVLLKHGGRIVLEDGTVEEVKDATPLCRCGGSGNKPYCDGTHRDIGFAADDTPAKQAAKGYTGTTKEGTGVMVKYNKLVCSHAAECGRLAGDVFDADKRPWIQPDNGSIDNVRAAVRACPSGALRLEEPGMEVHHITSEEVSVKVTKDGPYEVHNIPIASEMPAEGQTVQKYVLCRCGLSSNTPFCDGSHKDENWSADARNGS